VFQGGTDVTVIVRFAPAVARYVEESRWHDSQELSKQKDGSLTATFRLSNTEEIGRWVLSFGKFATVVEPAELRERITAEAEAILTSYRIPCAGRPDVATLSCDLIGRIVTIKPVVNAG